jgi:hypothetical protein
MAVMVYERMRAVEVPHSIEKAGGEPRSVTGRLEPAKYQRSFCNG